MHSEFSYPPPRSWESGGFPGEEGLRLAISQPRPLGLHGESGTSKGAGTHTKLQVGEFGGCTCKHSCTSLEGVGCGASWHLHCGLPGSQDPLRCPDPAVFMPSQAQDPRVTAEALPMLMAVSPALWGLLQAQTWTSGSHSSSFPPPSAQLFPGPAQPLDRKTCPSHLTWSVMIEETEWNCQKQGLPGSGLCRSRTQGQPCQCALSLSLCLSFSHVCLSCSGPLSPLGLGWE